MLDVDNNVNSVPKVSGTCFGKFEKSTQIDPKMFIFGHPDGCRAKESLGPSRHLCVDQLTMSNNVAEAKSYHGESNGGVRPRIHQGQEK